MRTKKQMMSVGSASIVMIFTVLCLTVFSTLAYETAYHEYRLAEKNLQAVEQYFAADYQAEKLYHDIEEKMLAGKAAEEICTMLPNVAKNDDGDFRYAVPIDAGQRLAVVLRPKQTGLQVMQWKTEATQAWEYKETLDVWDGE